jgi:hypothetical protein
MRRIIVPSVLAAVLLALSPVVAGQGSGDPPPRGDAPPWVVSGAFTADRTDDNVTQFHAWVEASSGVAAIMESFPEQFRVTNLSAAGCAVLHDHLEGAAFVARLSRCQNSAAHDASARPGVGFGAGLQVISFDLLGDGVGLGNYTVGDLPVITRIEYAPEPANVSHFRVGFLHTLRLDDDTLRVQDGRTGLVSYKAGPDGNGTLTITFPADSTIDRGQHGHGGVVHFGDREGVLVYTDAEWTGPHTLDVHGFLSFHLRPVVVRDAPGDDDGQLTRAIADRMIGAEVTVDTTLTTITDGVTIETFDDVEVTVERPAAVTRDTPLRIRVSAELDEGRTFVANIPAGLLGGADIEVRGFTVQDDGSRTELLLKEADDLADILDPSDDGGDFEYWIVHDRNGVQILVSAAHFSTHEFAIAGFGEIVAQPSVIVGIVVGALGAAVAAVAMFVPRRRVR